MSRELLVRLSTYPKMKAVLDSLPPKMLALASGQRAAPVELTVSADGAQVVEAVVARIQNATFTGRGDKNKVVELYRDYAGRIAACCRRP